MSGASATYHVQPPEPFTFSRPGEWPKWACRYERFRAASGLSEKDEVVQVNTLLYAMGDKADDVLWSFKLSETDQKKYSVVKANRPAFHQETQRNFRACKVQSEKTGRQRICGLIYYRLVCPR